MPTIYNYVALPQFAKEFTGLAKKYRSLPDDIENFKKVLAAEPTGNSKHFHVLAREQGRVVVKARFFCRYLKGASLRIIYVYSEKSHNFEFLELYFKGDKPNEDTARIFQYLKSLQ